MSNQNPGHTIIPPYLSKGGFNPDFLIDLPHGNAFQDYRGYETLELYRERYSSSSTPDNIFHNCILWISPSYRKSDWYLPSIGELVFLYGKKVLINLKIKEALRKGCSWGSFLSEGYYWSSTEFNESYAWILLLNGGHVLEDYKNVTHSIRAFLSL